MPLFRNALLCALAELVLCVSAGLPVARRLVADRPLALALSPVLGWAVFNTLALPILSWAGFGRLTVSLLCGAAVIGGIAALRPWRRWSATRPGFGNLSGCAYGASALLAVVPTLAVWPKFGGGGIVLAAPMFDHSKIAIIDDIVRLGLPPGNPFFGGLGSHSGLAYYYLWHFSAAMLSALVGASGWEADIALTWFTAFASLALMIGFAAKLGERPAAPFLVVLLSLAASLRPVLRLVLGPHVLGRALSQGPWPQSWIFQASWAPQHLAAAGCVVIAVLIMSRLSSARSWPLVPLLAVVVAAGFESSTWVGGVIFAAGALPIGVAFLLTERDARARIDLVLKGAVAIILVAAISFPFFRDEYLATAARDAGFPIALRPFEVLGNILPPGVRRPLDLGAYWAVLLVVQFPAIYLAGTAAMIGALARKGAAAAEKRLVVGFALLAGASIIVPWLFASTIANNDLAWRGVLPAVLVLTMFAAAGLSQWLATAPRLAMAADRLLGNRCARRLADRRGERRRACRPRRLQSWRRRRNCGPRCAGIPHPTNASPTIRSSLPTRCAGRSTSPGRSLPTGAPALPAGTWRALLCRCRSVRSTGSIACSSGSFPAPARRRTFATSPPSTIVG